MRIEMPKNYEPFVLFKVSCLMKPWLPIFLTFITLPAFAQSISASEAKKKMDAKYGFRDARFGTPVAAFKDLILYKNEGARRMYKRKNENLALGSYHLRNVVYTFYKGELSAVLYAIVGNTNVQGVKGLITAAYGQPQANKTPLEWRSQKVLMQWLPLDEGNVFFIAESLPLRNKREADGVIIDKKAASDL
jgi:hypothetical protein